MATQNQHQARARRPRLSPEKQAMLDRMLREGSPDQTKPGDIPRREQRKDPPLSFAQQRLWFVNRMEPDSANYNIPDVSRLVGELHVQVLERTLTEIVRRHEVLRTVFSLKNGEPVQVIRQPGPVSLHVVDLSPEDESRREPIAMELAEQEAARPFDLERGPLFRAVLLRIRDDEHILVLTFHHIVFDGWSTGVFFEELARLYGAFLRGEPSPLPEPALQYADFALWQRAWLNGGILGKQLSYWKEVLSGAPGTLALQTDHPRPAVQSYRGAHYFLTFPRDLLQGVRELSRSEHATSFMTLAAAFLALLHRYTGQDDIVIGTPIAGRSAAETERMIGFFVNTLLLRTDFSTNPPFLDLLRTVRSSALGAFQHQDLPFERLVEELHPERDPARSPLFQAMFVLQNAPMGSLNLPGLQLTSVNVDNKTAKFDLTLILAETPYGLSGSLNYNSDLFDRATIHRMAANLEVLLRGIVGAPEKRISELPLLGSEEQRLQLSEWNPAPSAAAPPACAHHLIEEQAAAAPRAAAVVCGPEQLSFAELNTRANRLAHRLQSLGVGPESLVGICLERSVEMIVAVLAVLKAGGAYVPLEPAYPKERLAGMLRDASVGVVITERTVSHNLPSSGMAAVFIDRDREAIASEPEGNVSSGVVAGNAAYVIFTSGSTGRPKGVLISHDALVSHCRECIRLFGLTPEDRMLQFVSLSFDVSVEQIFTPLIAGVRIVMRGPEVWTAGEFEREIERHGVTVASLPTAYWRQLVSDPPGTGKTVAGLRLVMVGGEALFSDAVMRWDRTPFHAARLVNAYGPTEATVMALTFDCSGVKEAGARETEGVPIGRPLSNRSAYILDRYRNAVPIGAAGELSLGGPALARGYVGHPEVTADKFVSNPFDPTPGSRLYRTGDVARYRPDGNIEFLGRADEQVKIRGYRVELGEIESVMKRSPLVRDAVAIFRGDRSSGGTVIVYYIGKEQPANGEEDLRAFAQDQLPEYMVPSAFVPMDGFPLTPHGKLDRNALPDPATHRPVSGADASQPHDQLEMQLVQIWEKVLGTRGIGVNENFFTLGGHSLLAVRLFSDIERLTGRNLPLATLFQAPTIRKLAAAIRSQGWVAPWSSLVAIKPDGARPPLFCFHAIGGNVLTYSTLAQYLDPDQPLYGIQSVGLDGTQSPLLNMEEMAAHYVKELFSVQPHGPYNLGGTCAGGSVALEVAQQLRALGEEVAFLGMFDAFPRVSNPRMGLGQRFVTSATSYAQRFRFHSKNVIFGPDRLGYIRKKTRTVKRRVKGRIWQIAYESFHATHRTLPKALQNVEQANTVALRQYVPRLYDGTITVFQVEEPSVGQANEPAALWGSLAGGGVEAHTVPGDHVSFFSEPHVQFLAATLNECLRRAHQGRGGSK